MGRLFDNEQTFRHNTFDTRHCTPTGQARLDLPLDPHF